jgi:hypothetical protein
MGRKKTISYIVLTFTKLIPISIFISILFFFNSFVYADLNNSSATLTLDENVRYDLVPPDGAIIIGQISTAEDFSMIKQRASNGTKIINVSVTREMAFASPEDVLGYVNVHSGPPQQFPIADDVLINIWKLRPDLQQVYPEVESGYLYNLKEWAKSSGWKDSPSLSALIPDGESTYYMTRNADDRIIFIIIVSIIISVCIGIVLGYRTQKPVKYG